MVGPKTHGLPQNKRYQKSGRRHLQPFRKQWAKIPVNAMTSQLPQFSLYCRVAAQFASLSPMPRNKLAVINISSTFGPFKTKHLIYKELPNAAPHQNLRHR